MLKLLNQIKLLPDGNEETHGTIEAGKKKTRSHDTFKHWRTTERFSSHVWCSRRRRPCRPRLPSASALPGSPHPLSPPTVPQWCVCECMSPARSPARQLRSALDSPRWPVYFPYFFNCGMNFGWKSFFPLVCLVFHHSRRYVYVFIAWMVLSPFPPSSFFFLSRVTLGWSVHKSFPYPHTFLFIFPRAPNVWQFALTVV